MSVVRLWVRLLLHLAWPTPFRRRFGSGMEETFSERWDEARARGRGRAAVLLARTTFDLLRSGVAERIDPSTPVSRATGGAPLMDWIGQDLRFAVRSLFRRPGFAAVAVFTLALGVGANTAIFSVVNGVLLRPLPFADQDRLVTVWSADEDDPANRGSMSRPDLLDVGSTDAFEAMVGYSPTSDALTGMGEAEAMDLARVTSGLLAVFGLEPFLGRDLALADTEAGATNVVVVSHGFWLERLGGDRNVLGRTLELRGEAHEIVGVAPPGFGFPDGVRMWRPFPNNPEDCGRGCHTYRVIGRLMAGVSLDAARAEATSLAERLQADFPDSNFQNVFNLVTLEEVKVGDVRRGLWMLLGAVGIVLLIACANVANLLLVRGQTRTGEVAVRSAMGASSRHLAIQVMVESLVLSFLGGALGLVLAFAGVDLLRGVSPGTIPRIDEVGVNGTVLLFTLGIVVLVAVLFGLGPALRLARSSPADGLASSGRGRSGSLADARSRGALLAGEVALSLILLVGAGLLLKSFARLYAVDPGYGTRETLRFELSLPEASYPDLGSLVRFYGELEERILAQPGVEAVGSGYGAPLSRSNMAGEVRVEGRPTPEPGTETYGSVKAVTPGYLATLGIPVLRGRGIEPSDDEGSLPVAVVNERFAQENFPGEDALGQRVQITAGFGYVPNPVWTIVGVVPNVRTRSLTEGPRAEIFIPHAQAGPGFRPRGPAEPYHRSSRAARREGFRSTDATLPSWRVTTRLAMAAMGALWVMTAVAVPSSRFTRSIASSTTTPDR